MPEEVVKLRAALEPVLAAHGEIAAVYVFGSVARSAAGPESDLDLGLVFRRRNEDALQHHRLIAELSYEIARHTEREHVDLVVLEPQGPIFCHQVLCDGWLIHENDRDRRIDFESDTMVRAFDFRPTWDLATRGKPEALRRWLRQRHDLR
jgi:predicted nucleotidyltransferase